MLGIQPRHDTNPVSDEAIERDERRAPSRAVTHHGNDVHRRPSPERADLDPEGHATSPAFAREGDRPPAGAPEMACRQAGGSTASIPRRAAYGADDLLVRLHDDAGRPGRARDRHSSRARFPRRVPRRESPPGRGSETSTRGVRSARAIGFDGDGATSSPGTRANRLDPAGVPCRHRFRDPVMAPHARPPRANDVHRGRRRIVREFVRILRRLCRALQVPRHARARVHRGRLPGAHRPRVATQRHVVVQARARRHVLPRVHHPTRRAQVRPEQGPASRRATFQSLPRPARERTRRTRRRRREGSRRGSRRRRRRERERRGRHGRRAHHRTRRVPRDGRVRRGGYARVRILVAETDAPRDFRSSESRRRRRRHALVRCRLRARRRVGGIEGVPGRRQKRSGKVVATRRTRRRRRRRRWPPRFAPTRISRRRKSPSSAAAAAF